MTSLVFIIGGFNFAYGATQDVRVTNWPTSYEVTNTSWSSRLANLESATSNLVTNVGNLVARFGWNSTLRFSDGFELLYNDVHSMATATSGSDMLTAFNREFPSNSSWSSTKTYIIHLRDRVTSLLATTNTIDTTTQHIDSDIHSLYTTVSNIYDNNDTFRRAFGTYSSSSLIYQSNISSKENQIKADTGNISVDTEHISDTQDILVSQSAITMQNVGILREFFADDYTLAQKAESEQASHSALDNFTGNGSSSASASDFNNLSSISDNIIGNFGTGNIDKTQALNLVNGNNQNAWDWFSQDTYNSLNDISNNRADDYSLEYYMSLYESELEKENRKVSDTPYLDAYYSELNVQIYGNER